MTTVSKVRTAMLADLARSGLTAKDADRLRLKPALSEETKILTKKIAVPAYLIPYLNPAGQETSYYRLRFLEAPPPLKKGDHPLRYWQPPGSIPRLYLPALAPWSKVIGDARQTLYITEGEKKAAAACKAGFPAIGLGGVWAWRAKKAATSLLDDFKLFTWKGRRVILVFDSDITDKAEVAVALGALARRLTNLGAAVETVRLPAAAGEKVGFDDYLVKRGAKAFTQLTPEPALGELAEELTKLNGELAYVEASEAVYRLPSRQFVDRTTLTGTVYAHRNVATFDDAGKLKELNVATEWLRWPSRRSHTRLTYAPGEPVVTATNELNIWRGWAVEPRKGDSKPFAELLDHLFRDAPQHKRWFLQWLAYPLQHPGAKLYSAAVLFSLGTGIGKSLVGLTLGKIYGQNFVEISQEQLHAPFNDWVVEKQFILGDDVTGSDRRRDADLLNTLITRESVYVNRKYQPTYSIPDRANYLFTTNQPDAFYLSGRDRRFFIHEVPEDKLDASFYSRYDRWYRSTAGAAALFYHLRQLDLTGFNPKAAPPETEAKMEMMDLALSDLDTFAHVIATSPDDILKIDGHALGRHLWTVSELREIYDPGGARKTTLIALAKALRRAGIKPIGNIKSNLIGGTHRVYAVQERDRWRRASHSERADRFDTERRATPAKRKEKF